MRAGDPVVLDASALLALIRGEPGGDAVIPHLPFARMSVVNGAECVRVLVRHGADPREARSRVESLGVELVPCNWEVAVNAGNLQALSTARGLSLGDCVCLATARVMGVPVLTADRSWRDLGVGIRIEVIR